MGTSNKQDLFTAYLENCTVSYDINNEDNTAYLSDEGGYVASINYTTGEERVEDSVYLNEDTEIKVSDSQYELMLNKIDSETKHAREYKLS